MIRSVTSLILTSILSMNQAVGQYPPQRSQTPQAQQMVSQMISLQQSKIKMWTEQAKIGNANAAYQLGLEYRGILARNASGGMTLSPDFKTSADWFLYAALHNNPDGAYEMGDLYFMGRPEFSVLKDHPKAYSMIRWAADHGSAKAIYFLTKSRDGQNLLAEVGKTYVPPTSRGEEQAKAMLLTILGAVLFTTAVGVVSGDSGGGSTHHGREYTATGMYSAACERDQYAALFGSDSVQRISPSGTPVSCAY